MSNSENIPCWYCGFPAAHHGMCYAHSVHFNGPERAAQFQKEHDEQKAKEEGEGPAP